jgi:hypothetical protein
MLHRDDVHIAKVQEIGGASIGVKFLFNDLKANFGRILVTSGDVVNGRNDTLGVARFGYRIP